MNNDSEKQPQVDERDLRIERLENYNVALQREQSNHYREVREAKKRGFVLGVLTLGAVSALCITLAREGL